MSDQPSIFSKLISEQPKKELEPKEPDIVRRGPQFLFPPTHSKSSPSEIMAAWLINCWKRPTITHRDIGVYGPNCARDPANRANLTKTLVEFGWLVPTKARRRDQKKFRVVRGPVD